MKTTFINQLSINYQSIENMFTNNCYVGTSEEKHHLILLVNMEICQDIKIYK